jgi:hypothetical protein
MKPITMIEKMGKKYTVTKRTSNLVSMEYFSFVRIEIPLLFLTWNTTVPLTFHG